MADSNMKSSIHVAHEYTDLADILPSSEEDGDGCIDKKVKEKELDQMFERKNKKRYERLLLLLLLLRTVKLPLHLMLCTRSRGEEDNNLIIYQNWYPVPFR